MKKLIMLACLAGAMCAFSDDAAPKAADAAKDKAPAVAQRQRPSPEEMKARREKFMADMKARREATKAKVLDALKEAGLDEAKAKETAEKIEKIMMEGRRMGPGMHRGPGEGHRRGPGQRPNRRPAPEAAPAAK